MNELHIESLVHVGVVWEGLRHSVIQFKRVVIMKIVIRDSKETTLQQTFKEVADSQYKERS